MFKPVFLRAYLTGQQYDGSFQLFSATTEKIATWCTYIQEMNSLQNIVSITIVLIDICAGWYMR